MSRLYAGLALSWTLTLVALGLAGATLWLDREQAAEIAALRRELAERADPAPNPPVAARPAPPPSPPPPPLPSADLGGPGGVSMADVVARVLPAVVNITTRGPRGAGQGSGVVVDAAGLVVTNVHVIAGASYVVVTLSDGRELPAQLVGADPQTDIAVLRLAGGRDLALTPIAYGDSSQLRLGDVVLAIGNPFGVGQTVTMGIVSAVGRAEMQIADYEDFIQTDAAINPGNSGGALVSMRGELVGINTAILSRTGGSHGIGFSIPSNMVRPIVESILRHGYVVRGWLGVTIQDVTSELASALGFATPRGVIVTGIEPGSPAQAAGVQVGDLIEQLDGERLTSSRQLRTLVATRGASAQIQLVVVRNGERMTLPVMLRERPRMPLSLMPLTPLPANPAHPAPDRGWPLFGLPPGLAPPGLGGPQADVRPPRGDLRGVDVGGLIVVDLDERVRRTFRIDPDVRAGAVVVDVREGTPGEATGLMPGDVIVEVNRKRIGGAAQFAHEYARAGGNAVLLYRHGPASFYVVMR
jgi:serine protease Do